MPEPLSDLALVRTCRGDVHTPEGRAAFRELVDRHLPLVFGCLRALPVDDLGVEEAAQETFLLLFREFVRKGTPLPLRPWLARTARHRARRILESSGPSGDRSYADFRMPGAVGRPEEAGERKGWEALGRIPDEDREPLLLRLLLGLTPDETASALEIPAESVREREHRALERLTGGLDSEIQERIRPALLHVPAGFLGRVERKIGQEARTAITATRLPAAAAPAPRAARRGILIAAIGAAALGLFLLLFLVYRSTRKDPSVPAPVSPDRREAAAPGTGVPVVPPAKKSPGGVTPPSGPAAAPPAGPPTSPAAAAAAPRGATKAGEPAEPPVEDPESLLVRRVEGRAVRHAEGGPTGTGNGLALRDGDRIRETDRITAADGPAAIVLDRRVRGAPPGRPRVLRPTREVSGDLEVLLAPGTEMRIVNPKRPRVVLAEGEVEVHIGDPTRKIDVETVAGRVVAQTGPWGFRYAVSLKGAQMRVGIVEGWVAVELGTVRAELGPDQETTVAVGGGIGESRPLDPEWIRWAAEARGGPLAVHREIRGAASGAEWQAVADGGPGTGEIGRDLPEDDPVRWVALRDGWMSDELKRISGFSLRRTEGAAVAAISAPVPAEPGTVHRFRFLAAADRSGRSAAASVVTESGNSAAVRSAVLPVGEEWNAYALEYRVPSSFPADGRLRLRFDWPDDRPLRIAGVRGERILPGATALLAARFDEDAAPAADAEGGVWSVEGGGLTTAPAGSVPTTWRVRESGGWSRYRATASVAPPEDGAAGLILAAAPDGSSEIRFILRQGSEPAWVATRVEGDQETVLGRRAIPPFAPGTAGRSLPGEPHATLQAEWVEDQLHLLGNGELLFQIPLGTQRSGGVGLVVSGGRGRFEHFYVTALQR